MKTHCIPPRQTCATCRTEVHAAQMGEREWRRLLWRFEVGSKIANVLPWAVAGALGHRVYRLCQSVADPFTFGALFPVLWEWRWVLGTELVLLALTGWLASWCYPKVIDWSQGNPEDWEEREIYRAAKLCRDEHEKTLWEASVEILRAQEAAEIEIRGRGNP